MLWSLPTCSDAAEVFFLGTLDWRAAVTIQKQLAFDLADRDDRLGFVLFCEHPPGISIGRAGDRSQIAATSSELSAKRVEVTRSKHGAGTLVHGPGQLAVYPVVPLARLGMGLQEYRGLLEQSLVAGCAAAKVSSEPADDSPGVTSRWGKLAEIGVAVRNDVAYYGAWLNVSLCPSAFDLVSREDKPATLEMALGRPVGGGSIRETIAHHLTAGLGYETIHYSTALPGLIRQTQPVYDFAGNR